MTFTKSMPENTTDVEVSAIEFSAEVHPRSAFSPVGDSNREHISNRDSQQLTTPSDSLAERQQRQLVKLKSKRNSLDTIESSGSYDFRTLPSLEAQSKAGVPRVSSINSTMNCTISSCGSSEEDELSEHDIEKGETDSNRYSRRRWYVIALCLSFTVIAGIALGVSIAVSATRNNQPSPITEGSSSNGYIPESDKETSSTPPERNNTSNDSTTSPVEVIPTTISPSKIPTKRPDQPPTATYVPTARPITKSPSLSPVKEPDENSDDYDNETQMPTKYENEETYVPTARPTKPPSFSPVKQPDENSDDYENETQMNPTKMPTQRPSPRTTSNPTMKPTKAPTKPSSLRPTPNMESSESESVSESKEGCITPASEMPVDGIFYPLDCNKNLNSESCTSWTSMFTNSATQSSEIVIPCGKCVNMDFAGDSLKLTRGLDIQGKLVFPNGYSVNIETPYIRVQGELEIISTKVANGQPNIRILLTGKLGELTQFVPADNNSGVCGQVGCDVGKKPVVVAGGKLDIRGLNPDTPTWIHLHDVSGYRSDSSVTSLIVSNTIQGTWGVGAEVLITSHTINYDDEQVRTISNISPHTEDGYVVIELDSAIIRPSTVVDNPDYAVEVALLSRNIVFEGARDDTSNPLHGAHLIVLQTPTVKQRLEGALFLNFGQQGNLGRYPIHFHMSHNVCGSVVSKNLIRQSNQRCVVVHGSHNLEVEGNVAYDTAGHCFITEDGNEQGNIFRRNLGALTRRVSNLIPNLGSNGRETDNEPATFWATNPSNTWEDNVAAGSERSGFWFELGLNVRGPSRELASDMAPMKEPLTLFKNNVAHSNGDHGLRTYPSGYIPDEQAVFFNTRAYRNKNDGVFIHNSRNLAVVGGVYADNMKQLDIDAAEQIELRDASVVGFSKDYRDVVSSQDVNSPCGQGSRPIYGVQLHTFTRQDQFAPLKDYGTVLKNIDVSGFVDTGCIDSLAFDLDSKVETKHFDYFSSFSDINMEDGTTSVNFCEAQGVGVIDIFLTDLDSSFSTSSYTGTSSLVSSNNEMTAFLDTSRCTEVSDLCYTYCEEACLRGVTYQVNSAGTENYKLKVCDRSSQPTCVQVEGKYYDSGANSQSTEHRYFGVALPRGSYDAVFLDKNNNEVLPSYVEEVYEEIQCADFLEDGSIDLKAPSLDSKSCSNLIKNGDAEASETDPANWLQRSGGIQVKSGAGIGGTHAFSGVERVDLDLDGIVQYLDSRCMQSEIGNKYELHAWVKLVKDGKAYKCNTDDERCPEARLTNHYLVDDKQVSKIFGRTMRYHTLSEGYFLVHGLIEITEEMAGASSVQLEIRRNRMDADMFVDNVSMKRIEQSTCKDLVSNGDFQVGDSRFWETSSAEPTSLTVVANGVGGSGDYALQASRGTPHQELRTGCLEVGERYVATSKFKLLNDGVSYACDNEPTTTGSTKCPSLRWRTGSQGTYSSKAFQTIGFPSNNGWNTLWGVFTATEFDVAAENVRLGYDDVLNSRGLVIDDVSVTKLPMDCSELIMNGDMELGYPTFWKPNGAAGEFSYLTGYKSSTAIRYSGRSVEYEDSLIDYRCLKPGSQWKITAQIKLLAVGSDSGATCDPKETNPNKGSCPSIKVILHDAANSDNVVLEENVYNYVSPTWNPNDFNKFEGTFNIPSTGATKYTELTILVRDFDADNMDVVIDDFSIKPL